ncbi:MAG: CRISPR-associated protein Cas5 [Thermomicrobium sp.]|nr:CRISPR-associated protein Cas5 [Thermomicrobium sp.]
MTVEYAQMATDPHVWVCGTFEFGTTFSYRLPDASSQFAIGVPVPSPTAVKLGLVAAALHESGDFARAERVFEIVRDCSIWYGLPERLTRFRAFIKRLKPEKEDGSKGDIPKSFLESTGTRDYFLMGGEVDVFLSVEREHLDLIVPLLGRIRRLGTTDSLCYCVRVTQQSPERERCAVPLSEIEASLEQLERTLVSLLDLSPTATFDQIDPYRQEVRRGNPFVRITYALPLRVEAAGPNWALFQRTA